MLWDASQAYGESNLTEILHISLASIWKPTAATTQLSRTRSGEGDPIPVPRPRQPPHSHPQPIHRPEAVPVSVLGLATLL